jgi:sugar phosphate isomerase/epimerase
MFISRGEDMPHFSIAVQMYTLRNLIKNQSDFLDVTKQVAQIGYQGIEITDMRSILPADQLRARMSELGLQIVGVHVPIEQLENNLDLVTTYYAAAGVHHIIMPWLSEDRRRSGDDWLRIARELSKIADRLNRRGLLFSYHNHDFEFAKHDGKTGMDIILKNTPPEKMRWEADVYWLQFAGMDPVATIRQHSNRISLLHCKDMAAGPAKRFAPVGTGILDWLNIFQAASAAHIQWMIVEQDDCYETSPLDAIRISFEKLRGMDVV